MIRERKGEVRLFFRRWLAHPLRVGALFPSGVSLSTAVAKVVQSDYRAGEYVVELGPGTGAVTRALIDSGIPEERLIMVERDQDMVGWLSGHFPKADILCSDAKNLDKTLSKNGKDKVFTVVSSLPFTNLSEELGEEIVKAIFKSLEARGKMVQYTYSLLSSPIPCRKWGVLGKRESLVWGNIPPAAVWSFSRTSTS